MNFFLIFFFKSVFFKFRRRKVINSFFSKKLDLLRRSLRSVLNIPIINSKLYIEYIRAYYGFTAFRVLKMYPKMYNYFRLYMFRKKLQVLNIRKRFSAPIPFMYIKGRLGYFSTHVMISMRKLKRRIRRYRTLKFIRYPRSAPFVYHYYSHKNKHKGSRLAETELLRKFRKKHFILVRILRKMEVLSSFFGRRQIASTRQLKRVLRFFKAGVQ